MKLPLADPRLVQGILIVAGLIVAFFGRRLLHGLARVYGLIAGVILGAFAMPMLVTDGRLPVWVMFVGIGLLGVLGFVLGRSFYSLWVFSTAASAVQVVWLNLPVLAVPAWVNWVAPMVLGLMAGLLAVKFERSWVIVATALLGACVAGVTGCQLAHVSGPWEPAAAGVLAVAGLLTQFAATGKMPERRDNRGD
jgi:hypothetical protein